MMIEDSGITRAPSCSNGILAIGHISAYALFSLGAPSTRTVRNGVSDSYSASSTFQQYDASGCMCKVSGVVRSVIVGSFFRQRGEIAAQTVEAPLPLGTAGIDPVLGATQRAGIDRNGAHATDFFR